MVMQTLYAIKTMRDPLYRTRMLKAGEPIELSGPDARLYLQLKVATAEKPKRVAKPVTETAETVEAPKPAPRKRTKRTRKAKS